MWILWVTLVIFVVFMFIVVPYLVTKQQIDAGLPSIGWMRNRVIERSALKKILFSYYFPLISISVILAIGVLVLWVSLGNIPLIFAFLLTVIVAGLPVWGLAKLFEHLRDRALEKASTPKPDLKR
jgi:hypothetical protein